jgi:hypothetical protein
VEQIGCLSGSALHAEISSGLELIAFGFVFGGLVICVLDTMNLLGLNCRGCG